LTELPTKVFFYGLRHGQEIEVNLEPGKTLYVTLKGISSPDPRGIRNVFFSLNGFDREISVQDESLKQPGPQRIKADGMNPSHVAAPMPGKVILVKKKPGDETQKGEALVVIEAMKMEYGVSSKVSGQVKEILVKAGDMVEQGDLIGVVELS
jgi:pyruvate carboxylase